MSACSSRTTATALAWTLHELGKDPVAERKAREAAVRGDDDHLEAVLKESMRLHPVIPMVVRHLMEPATIGGVDLPAGANVAASIILAHSSEASHPDHAAFRPERFLEGEVTADWLIIGAGFAGLTAARRLTQVRPGERVVILDAQEVAKGTAGRNSGFMIDVPHNLGSGEYSSGDAASSSLEMRQNRYAIAYAKEIAAAFEPRCMECSE